MYVVRKIQPLLVFVDITLCHGGIYNLIQVLSLQDSYGMISIDFTGILPVTLQLNNMSKNPLYNVNHSSSILNYFAPGTYIMISAH